MKPFQTRGVLAAMLFVTDLTKSVSWYRDLLGLAYLREFENAGTVTGCSLADPDAGFLLSFRLRSATAAQPDARGEHPLIFGVEDLATLDRVYAHAEALGYRPSRGEHTDAHWVEVIDPDGQSTRFAFPIGDWHHFIGVRGSVDGGVGLYDEPVLDYGDTAGREHQAAV
jgi:catechol 2,3-dioxygenase-like lactoylglutathione lyase family enzyme